MNLKVAIERGRAGRAVGSSRGRGSFSMIHAAHAIAYRENIPAPSVRIAAPTINLLIALQ
jgi:hypothetical protein